MSAANLNGANVSLDDQATDSGLPEGWVAACLGDVANARLGKTPRRVDYRDSGIHRIVKFRDIADNTIDYSKLKAAYVVTDPAVLRGLRPLNIRDVLITASAHSGDQIGKKCAYIDHLPEVQGGIYFVGELLGVTSDPRVMDSKWPYYWLLSEDGFRAVQSAVAGVHLTAGRAQSIPIPIAPLEEQRRIVQKLERFLPSITAVRERLAKVLEILKRFRQSVLTAAFSGRLTTEWRVVNPKLEPAEQLFKRVCVERQKKYKAECKKTKSENRKIPKKTANLEPRKVDVNQLPEIPEDWMWVYLPDFGYMNRGKSRHRPRNAPHLYDGPYPFIQTGDIAQSGGRITSHRQTYSESGLAQSRMWPAGTICITIAANIANSAILTYPACFPDSVVGVLPDNDLCPAEYLEYFIRTAQANLDQFAPATSQKNINIDILSNVAVPLPPLAEQNEIVRRVDALFKLADAIEKRVAAVTVHAEKLIQAILAKAFHGGLVPTEAELAKQDGRSYEPASALLAKIKAQRKDIKPHRKRGRALQRRNNISGLTS